MVLQAAYKVCRGFSLPGSLSGFAFSSRPVCSNMLYTRVFRLSRGVFMEVFILLLSLWLYRSL